jgi:hypothetical protein
MAEPRFRLILATLLFGVCVSGARAESTLQGLEMDVMDPDESAAQATARIALPRPRGSVERSAENPGLETDARIGLPGGGRLEGAGADGLFTGELAPGPLPGGQDPAIDPPVAPPDVPGDGYTAPVDTTGGPGG